jgi:hypothetical protein
VCEELGQRRRSYIVWWFLAMAAAVWPGSCWWREEISMYFLLTGGCTTFQAAQFFFFCFCCFCKLSLDLSATWFSTLNSSVPPTPQNIHFCILDTAGAFLLLDHHESLNSKSHVMINAALQSTFSWSMQEIKHFLQQTQRPSKSFYSSNFLAANVCTMYLLPTRLVPHSSTVQNLSTVFNLP